MRRTRLVLVAVIVAAASFGSTLAAGALQEGAPAKSTPLKPYVHGLCVDLLAWRDKLQKLTATYKTDAQASTSIDEVATKTVTFFNDAGTATDAFARQLAGLGTPKTSNGAKITAALVKGFTAIATSFRSAATQAAALPTADPTAFATGLQSIGSTSDKKTTAAVNNIKKIGRKYGSAFDAAARSDSVCKPVLNS